MHCTPCTLHRTPWLDSDLLLVRCRHSPSFQRSALDRVTPIPDCIIYYSHDILQRFLYMKVSSVILYYTATQYILAIFIFAHRVRKATRTREHAKQEKILIQHRVPPLLCNSVFTLYTPSDSRGRIPLIQSTMTPLPKNCGIILPLNSLRSPRAIRRGAV